MKHKVIGVCIASVSAVSAVSACGSSSPATGSASAPTNVAASASFTGTPIVVGETAPENSAQANFPGVHEAAIASIDTINAAGGITTPDGKTHELKLDFCNNQGTPSGSVQCATTLIADHVVALVGTADQNSNMADPLYTKAGVANFSNTALTEWDLAGSDSYPTVGSATFAFAGLGDQLGKAGYKNVRPMGVAESAAAITPLFDTMGAALKAAGSTLLKPVLFPAATTDYAPVASQAMAGNPDAVVIIGNPTVLPPLGKAIVALGGKTPNLANVDGTFTPQDFAATGGANTFFNGALVTALLPDATVSPQWAPYRAAIAKYQPGTQQNTLENASSQVVWVGMNAFKTIASTISGAVTSASFKAALDQTTSLSTGGLTPTLNFTKPFACGPFARSFNTTYYGPMTVKAGAFTDEPGAALQDASSLVLNGFGPACKATSAQLGVS